MIKERIFVNAQGKILTLEDGLEFRLRYHLYRGGGGVDLLGKSKCLLRKDKWTLRRADGRYDKICLGVASSPVMSQSSLVDETPREGIYDN